MTAADQSLVIGNYLPLVAHLEVVGDEPRRADDHAGQTTTPVAPAAAISGSTSRMSGPSHGSAVRPAHITDYSAAVTDPLAITGRGPVVGDDRSACDQVAGVTAPASPPPHGGRP